MAKRYLSGCGQEEQEKKSTLLADTLETAQSLGLTRRGEFFIHTHLATLCKTVCSGMDTGRVIQLSSAMDVVATLHNGGVLATVYDADVSS